MKCINIFSFPKLLGITQVLQKDSSTWDVNITVNDVPIEKWFKKTLHINARLTDSLFIEMTEREYVLFLLWAT